MMEAKRTQAEWVDEIMARTGKPHICWFDGCWTQWIDNGHGLLLHQFLTRKLQPVGMEFESEPESYDTKAAKKRRKILKKKLKKIKKFKKY
jgi:hypothetical protein